MNQSGSTVLARPVERQFSVCVPACVGLARPPELMSAIREYADSIHPYRDGRSSERVLDAVDQFIAAGGSNPRPKPRNWWRKLKIRRRIRYWGRA